MPDWEPADGVRVRVTAPRVKAKGSIMSAAVRCWIASHHLCAAETLAVAGEAPAPEAQPKAADVLARTVRAWLRADGEPLKALADDLGVAKSTISQWAHGQRFPKPGELDRIAQRMGVPLPCLLCATLYETLEQRTAPPASREAARGLRVHDS